MKIQQQVTQYCGKEEKLLLRSFFSSFPQYFQYISIFRSQSTYSFVKCGCLIYFFLNSANLICRGTYISKYFRESIGLRDNESRLCLITKFFLISHIVWCKCQSLNSSRQEYQDKKKFSGFSMCLVIIWLMWTYDQEVYIFHSCIRGIRFLPVDSTIFTLRNHAYSNILRIFYQKMKTFR